MSDAWIFGVVDFCPNLLHCRGHPLRFGDGNNVIVGAVKYPDWDLADSFGRGCVLLGGIRWCEFYKIGVGLLCGCGRANTSADYDKSCEGSVILLCKMPCPVASHG